MAHSILLASASPRRKQLLEQLGIQVQQQAADIDESAYQGERAAAYVQRIAKEKAQAIAACHADALILAADTCISLDGQIIGKPQSFLQACAFWRSFAQRWHSVYTAVVIYNNGRYLSALCQSDVYFSTMSDAQMHWYWQTGEPQDKAGAYAIQGLGARWVKEIRGSYSAIMGLPLYETAELLQQLGIALEHG